MHAKDMLERAAVTCLEGCGFRILDRDWRCANGALCPEPGALRPPDRADQIKTANALCLGVSA